MFSTLWCTIKKNFGLQSNKVSQLQSSDLFIICFIFISYILYLNSRKTYFIRQTVEKSCEKYVMWNRKKQIKYKMKQFYDRKKLKSEKTQKINMRDTDIFRVFIRFLTSKNDLTKDRHFGWDIFSACLKLFH